MIANSNGGLSRQSLLFLSRSYEQSELSRDVVLGPRKLGIIIPLADPSDEGEEDELLQVRRPSAAGVSKLRK